MVRAARITAVAVMALAAKSLPGRCAAAAVTLDVTADSAAGFIVSVGGRPWLISAPSTLFAGRADHPVHLQSSGPAAGTDALGAYQADTWIGSAGGIPVEAAIRQYPARGAVTFDIRLPNGANSTQRKPFNISVYGHPGQVPPMLDFPAFSWSRQPSTGSEEGAERDAAPADLGLFTIGGDQIGQATLSWGDGTCGPPPHHHQCAPQPSNLGRSAGPFLLFEDPRDAAVAICPLTHFHTATSFYDSSLQKWQWGPSGELTSLPPGFTHRCVSR